MQVRFRWIFIGYRNCLGPIIIDRLCWLLSGARLNDSYQTYTINKERLSLPSYPLPSPNRLPSPLNLACTYGNIDPFPFRCRRLRSSLGATNSRLTTYCRETLGLSVDPIFTDLSCYYYQDLHWGSVHPNSRPGFIPALTPPYRKLPLLGVPYGIGSRLKPRSFSGPCFLANKLLRTYYRVAVSEPTFMLSLKHDAIQYHTEPTLRDLNHGLSCFSLGAHAYRG